MAERVRQLKANGIVAAGSLTPQRVRDYITPALDAGLDILVIQGTVVSAEHVSTVVEPLDLKQFIPSCRSRRSSAAAPPSRPPCT